MDVSTYDVCVNACVFVCLFVCMHMRMLISVYAKSKFTESF